MDSEIKSNYFFFPRLLGHGASEVESLRGQKRILSDIVEIDHEESQEVSNKKYDMPLPAKFVEKEERLILNRLFFIDPQYVFHHSSSMSTFTISKFTEDSDVELVTPQSSI